MKPINKSDSLFLGVARRNEALQNLSDYARKWTAEYSFYDAKGNIIATVRDKLNWPDKMYVICVPLIANSFVTEDRVAWFFFDDTSKVWCESQDERDQANKVMWYLRDTDFFKQAEEWFDKPVYMPMLLALLDTIISIEKELIDDKEQLLGWLKGAA